MSNGYLKIDILGASFSIQADEDSAYLEEIYCEYKKIVSQIEAGAKLHNSTKTAILAGIMLCDELHKARNKVVLSAPSSITTTDEKKDLQEAEKIALRLIEKINKVL